MAITPPRAQSFLAIPTLQNSFIAVQSAQLAVTAASASVTFTDLPGTLRITAIITNSGSAGCYLATGATTATAVVSTSTPAPATGTEAVANCFYLAAGAIYTLDFVAGTNTFAAICAGVGTTTLEISVGWGA